MTSKELQKLRDENDRLMAKIITQFNTIDIMISQCKKTLREIKELNKEDK